MTNKYTNEPDRLERTRIENRRNACMIRVADTELCVDPSLPFLNLMGKKHTLLILSVIGNQPNGANFNEILKDIPFSSSTLISKRLKELVNQGIVSRDRRNGRITYSLSISGQGLRDAIIPLIRVLSGFDADKSLLQKVD